MFVHETYDAVVIGARCAGAATAMLMARKGMRVLLIDRGGYGADTISTHALMRTGVLQLHRWGVLPRLLEAGTPAVRATTFHYGDEAVTIPIKPSHGVDALYAPRRTLLDSTLVDAAREAGATVLHGHTLVRLARGRGGRVCGATVLDAEGNALAITADLVVGADGIGSTVARLVEPETLLEARYATALIFGYFQHIDLAGYHWWYRPGVGAGAIPTNGGRHCVFAAMPPGRLWNGPWRDDRRAAFDAVLGDADPALAASLAGAQPDERLHVFAGRKGYMRQAFGPGWALVGDAGYFKDPLTAHGISDALRDAELLANAAAGGTTAHFEDYAATRDALSLPLFEVSDAIAALDWDLDQLGVLHQTLNLAMKREVEHLATLGEAYPTMIEEAVA
jgi:2-polyprenyl-6-methoxyphenol hydroxylase-like FAD-dependent oxidoreductase